MRKICFLLTVMLTLLITTNAQQVTVFKNVNLISMSSDKIIPNQTVIIKENKIEKIGNNSEISIPDSSEIIDGTGKYLMPGLADMHVHAVDPITSFDFSLYLAYGVTSIRDCGAFDKFQQLVDWKKQIKDKKMVGPMIYNSLRIDGNEPNPIELLSKHNDEDYDFIKPYGLFDKKTYPEFMKLTKTKGKYTAGHIPLALGIDGAVANGLNEIAHVEEFVWEASGYNLNIKNPNDNKWGKRILSSFVKKYFRYIITSDYHSKSFKNKINADAKYLVSKVKDKGIFVTTSLIADSTATAKVMNTDGFMLKPENKYLSPIHLYLLATGQDRHQKVYKLKKFSIFWYELCKAIFKELENQGVTLVLGTDIDDGMGLVPGFSAHEELALMVQNGLTPYQAIQTATKNAGIVVKRMTGRDEIGTIEIGKRADLILVNKNPFLNVSNIKDNSGVLVNGTWFSSEQLNKMIEFDGEPSLKLYKAAKALKEKKNDALFLEFIKENKNKLYFPTAYPVLIQFYKKQKNIEKLNKVYDVAVEEFKNKPYFLNNYGWFVYENRIKNSYPKAIEYMVIAIKQNPKGIYNYWDTLAWLYYENGQKTKAIEAMEKAVETSNGEKTFKDNLTKLQNKK